MIKDVSTTTDRTKRTSWHPFETALSVIVEDIEFEFVGFDPMPWSDYLLNPRRLRGSDFLMRWAQGQWSEHRLMQAVSETNRYLAIPYGPSSVAPDEPRGFELYFERLAEAGVADIKRPDLLVFQKEDEARVNVIIERIGGLAELPFTSEDDPNMRELLLSAVVAIECENSLWRASKMPNVDTPLTPQKRLGGKMGLKKSAVLPTVTLKEEDRAPLRKWQDNQGVPIHIWQALYDTSFGISLDRAEELIGTGLIQPKEQVFQAPNGAVQRKELYFIYRHYTYPVGNTDEEPTLTARALEDKNGRIMPYVVFDGGHVSMREEALKVLDEIADAKA
jgi:AccI restriction endonuclease